MALSVRSSLYVQTIPVATISANQGNIVSMPANHPDSINFLDLSQNAYLSQCWSLCQDVAKIFSDKPLFLEAIKKLCHHKYTLKPVAVRSDEDSLSLILKKMPPELITYIYAFQNNDDSLVWEVFPNNTGDCGDCTRKKTTLSGESANLCHFTYIKDNYDPTTNFPTTISHPKGNDFNRVIQHCELLFCEILNPQLKVEETHQKILELNWWMGQGGLFKSGEKKHRLPQGQKDLPNINGPYIEIFIAALHLYKFKQTPHYNTSQSSYHLSLATSLEEFKTYFSQLVENRD